MLGGVRVCMDYYESWLKFSGFIVEGVFLFVFVYFFVVKKEDDWWIRVEG